jgi:hypothetical protein
MLKSDLFFSFRRSAEMPKLNQVVAVVNGKKSRLEKDRDSVYKNLQKSAIFQGITRTYHPDNEEGDQFPPESKHVQFSVKEAVEQFETVMTDLLDATATLDHANTVARADVTVDGKTVLPQVPVTNLMFLEKQLTDVQTFINHIPTLDPAFKWEWDATANCYRTEETRTVKSKKQPTVITKAEATDKHPAQTEIFMEDVRIGEWSTTHLSGAIPAEKKQKYLERVRSLLEAVKFAREEANSTEAERKHTGKALFNFIFEG